MVEANKQMKPQIILDGKTITNDSPAYVVAEIGHNHQGNLAICKEMFLAAKQAGADAVKLQKRDNKALFTKTYYNRPYDNKNSYGKTYGEHREALEFGRDEYIELRDYAEEIGITFFATPFDIPSVDFLVRLSIDKIFKIASADLTNIPLIDYVASLGSPMIISTGGGNMVDIRRITLNLFCDYSLLHCVATYPNQPEQINLEHIKKLKSLYENRIIGYSNHHPSVYMCLGAYMMGARIIEVHFTLNRAGKGTDHAISLEPKGLQTLCSDLKSLHEATGDGKKIVLPEEKEAIDKMGKSIYPARTLKKGEQITEEDVCIKSPGGGMPPYWKEKIIGNYMEADTSTGIALTRSTSGFINNKNNREHWESDRPPDMNIVDVTITDEDLE